MTPTTPSTAPCGQLNRKQIEEILNGAGFTDEAKTSLCRLALVGLAGKNMPTWKDFINSRKLVAYDGTFTAGTFWVKLTDDGPQISKEVYETIAEALLSAQSGTDVAKAVAFLREVSAMPYYDEASARDFKDGLLKRYNYIIEQADKLKAEIEL